MIGTALLLVPLGVFGVGVIRELRRGQRRGPLVGTILCVATIAVGVWGIREQRDAMAGFGILFLPFIAAFGGACGLVWGALSSTWRKSAWLVLILPIALLGLGVNGALQVRARHLRFFEDRADQDRRLEENRSVIAALLADNTGREEAVLDAAIQSHLEDRTFLRAALETPFVSEHRLDQLSDPAHDAMLSVIRNKRTPAATLSRIFRSQKGSYYSLDLASHGNTPVEILREINESAKQWQPGMLDRSLARNPSLPSDLFAVIVRNGDVPSLQTLLRNPGIGCDQLHAIVDTLPPQDAGWQMLISDREKQLCGKPGSFDTTSLP